MRASRKLLWLVPILLLPLLPAGCASTTQTSGQIDLRLNAVCLEWRAVTWSQKDTDQTIKEVKGSNAARKGFGCS